ncbi:hypothetical protein D3C86_1987660 [compost metagenome]
MVSPLGDHWKVIPGMFPVTVNSVLSPSQKDGVPVMFTASAGITAIVTVESSEHPFAEVTVNVYAVDGAFAVTVIFGVVSPVLQL